MIIISPSTVGRHFILLRPGIDIIGFWDQYLSTMTGKWTPSTYAIKEGYTNPKFVSNYRRPIDTTGKIIVIAYIIKKYWNKIIKK